MSDPSLSTTSGVIQGLLHRLAQGDANAKKTLIGHSYGRLRLLAHRLVGETNVEDATEVLHGAFERLERALDDVKPTNVADYLGLAALQIRRQLLDRIRHYKGRAGTGGKAKHVAVSLNAGGDSSQSSAAINPADPKARPDRVEMALELLEAIDILPDDERRVVELKFIDGCTEAEAGQILGVHEDTVKRRWARARVKLAKKLAVFGPEN
jgi:RNA polymerase sigma factor (sigma-70 family)